MKLSMWTQEKLIVFFVVLLDYAGLNAVSSILPSLLLTKIDFLYAGSWVQNNGAMLIGITIATYALGQVIGALFWGKLSDVLGRKPVLQMGVLGNGCGFLISYLGIAISNIYLLILGRLVSGLFAGNVAVALSVMSDVSADTKKASNYRIIQIAIGLGLIIGPVIVAITSSRFFEDYFNIGFSFLMMFFLQVINFMVLLAFFKETKISKNNHALNNKHKLNLNVSSLRSVLLTWAIYIAGLMLLGQFLPSYLVKNFNFTTQLTGYFLSLMGFIYCVFQFFVVKKMADFFSSQQIVKVMLLGVSFSVLLIFLAQSMLNLWFASCFYYLSLGLLMPNIYAVISDRATPEAQGYVMGRMSAIQGIMTVVTSLLGGIMLSIQPKFIIFVSALLMAMSWFAFLYHHHHHTLKDVVSHSHAVY